MTLAEVKNMLDQKAQVMALEEDMAYRLGNQDERMRCMGFKQGCQFAASLVQGLTGGTAPKARPSQAEVTAHEQAVQEAASNLPMYPVGRNEQHLPDES